MKKLILIGMLLLSGCVQRGELPKACSQADANHDIQEMMDSQFNESEPIKAIWPDTIILGQGRYIDVHLVDSANMPDLDSMIANPWDIDTAYYSYAYGFDAPIVKTVMVIDTNLVGTLKNFQEILRRIAK